MPDQRELYSDPEEGFRSAWAGIRNHMYTALPVIVAEDSADGHTVKLSVAVKRTVQDRTLDQTTYQDFPLLVDVPIKFPSGGGVTLTHPVKQGDEGLAVFSSRSIDAWFQSGGSQQQIFNRLHSLADAFYVPGVRSVPRKIQQVEPDSAQIRSDDKRHVIEQHPQNGTHIKSADPSTPPASLSFDPFKQATKYLEHLVQGTSGLFHRAVDGSTKHNYSLTHDAGHVMDVVNGLHSVLAHPTNGASLNAENLLHQVLAHPSLGALLSAAQGQHMVQAHPEQGVSILSAIKVAIAAPSVSMPSGSLGGAALALASVPSAALAVNASSDNIGALGGDLSGTLPNPQVVGLSHVTKGNLLPNFANDTAAATGGVPIGGIYRSGSNLCVRVS